MASSGSSHLSSGKINLGVLRDHYRRELVECIDRCTGTKALVWDDALTGPFGLVAEYSLLKDHEVEKMFPLGPKTLQPSNVQNIIFLTRPKLKLMELIAQNLLNEDQKGTLRTEFHLIFVPRKSLLCEKKLKEMGVYGTFTSVDEFSLELVPFDNDLLSMEMDTTFRECYLENDFTSMFYVAQSIMTLQALYGIIPYVNGKGDCAKQVVEMMRRMKGELGGREPQITPQIDNLLIIDRNVDLLTPLLSQLTYEGLIDETFGLNNTSVKLPAEKFVPKNQKSDEPLEPKKFVLNSSDELYADLRDKNFNAVGSIVSRKAKAITAEFDERHQAKTVGEMKQFVTKLPHLQKARESLATHVYGKVVPTVPLTLNIEGVSYIATRDVIKHLQHYSDTSIAELVKEATNSEDFMDTLRCQQDFTNCLETDKVHPYIEECIAKKHPITKILRLICIQSYCNDGMKPKVLEYYKREIIQTYGFEHMLTLMNLERTGLLRPSSARTYAIIKKSLRLIVEDVHEQNPNDIAYVYSGYAPLSVRLAQHLARPGWRSITEVLNLLPGPKIEEIQQIPVALRKRRNSMTSSHSSTGDQKVTLVFFLGGVTYAEIAALRFLAQQDDGGTDYLIATTKIINGDSFIELLKEKVDTVKLNPF